MSSTNTIDPIEVLADSNFRLRLGGTPNPEQAALVIYQTSEGYILRPINNTTTTICDYDIDQKYRYKVTKQTTVPGSSSIVTLSDGFRQVNIAVYSRPKKENGSKALATVRKAELELILASRRPLPEPRQEPEESFMALINKHKR